MAFKQIRVSPVLDVDAYDDDDILFALTEIPLPVSDAVLLRNITVVDRAKVDAEALDLQLLFMNTDDRGIGTVQGSAVSLTAFNARNGVIGFCHFKNTTQSADADFDNFNITSTTDNKLTTGFNGPIVLQPLPGGRSAYFTAVSVGETPTFAGATGVLVDGAVSAGASDEVVTDTVAASIMFNIGDTVVDADDNVVGTVKSITAGPNSGEEKITFNAVTGEALANNEELFTPHSLEFIFDIEY